MTALLQVDNLTTGYDHVPILREVSVDVDAREIVGVLGANGAGKTTLLRAISGSLRAWHGCVTLDGEALGRKSTWGRAHSGLAHVPEGRHVFTAMTVRENLEVAGLLSRNAAERRDGVYDLFPRLAEREKQAAGSLSGGEQQMLAIGRALMTSPKLLLIDEMSAGLAPVITLQLVDALRTIRNLGVSTLLVEQSPNYLVGIVDRVYLLGSGRVVGAGSLDDLGGVDALAAHYLGVGTGSAPVPATNPST
jgi:branched-chain amino acid transport system ATP-binding protein